ncbi:MAG: hypothetical protein P8M30_13315 [Planctomycetaceae bacterium]|jgi:hypothetical protein|nr:hypothetical protein [Planctomycetaceae bacterium]
MRFSIEYLRIVKASFFVVSAIFLAGCGGDTGYSGPTGTVSGTITLDDQPVAANLTFMNSIDGFTASGVADGSGKFSLQSNGETAIPVGKYQVGVTAAADGPEMDPEAAMKASMESEDGSAGGSDSAIPTKYASPAGSGLSFEVKEGDNSFEVKMTKE